MKNGNSTPAYSQLGINSRMAMLLGQLEPQDGIPLNIRDFLTHSYSQYEAQNTANTIGALAKESP
jgi:hypothetical protein